MAMASIGGAFTAASSFLGLGARMRADAAMSRDVEDDADADAFDPCPDDLAPGAPCFEAVAQALAEAGYLDS